MSDTNGSVEQSHGRSFDVRAYATKPISREWYPTYLVCISFIIGLTDATTILGLDGVFVANQTGNLIYFACGIASPEGQLREKIAPAILSLGCYCIGGFLGARMANNSFFKGLTSRLWLVVNSLIVTGLYTITIIIMWTKLATTKNNTYLASVALLGLGVGLQVVTSRALGVSEISSNVLTGTFTDLFGDLNLFKLNNEKRNRRLATILAMFLGTLIGAFVATYAHSALPLVIAVGLYLGLVLLVLLVPGFQEVREQPP